MGLRVTADELREILSVARKLRVSAQDEEDEDTIDLYLRAAAALEDRARQLAFNPFDIRAAELEEEIRAMRHKRVNIVC
jgi:chemotaxis protein histidine kinase CheA